MSEQEDLELQALQRQLDDAFQTTRPRPAFEDELWLRMQARRPIWARFREVLAGLREAPRIPSGVVAIALIVVIGAGIITLGGGLHFGPSGGATSASLDNGGGKNSATAAPAFGPLPLPAMVPGPGQFVSGPPSTHVALYAAPVVLTWSGRLTVTSSSLPVFRYAEPSVADADAFAVSAGAAPSAHVAPGGLGMYTGNGFTLVVNGTVAQPAHEPAYELSELKSLPGGAPSDPVAAAGALLAAHHLTPTWPFQTDVESSSTTVQVRYLRSLDLKGQGQAPLVNSAGDRYGIEVDIPTSSPGAFVSGPFPVTLDSVSYPIISADQAVRAALATSAPAGSGGSIPTVRLTSAELVYTLAWGGDHSFYEPAFLFSGTFTSNGTNYVKRVLVPAVAPPLLSP